MQKEFHEYDVIFIKNDLHYFFVENDEFTLDIVELFHLDRCMPNLHYTQPTLHKHYNYELQMILRGCCQFETYDGSLYTLQQGQFMIFSPEMKHRIVSESTSYKKFIVTFSFTPKITDRPSFYQTAETLASDLKTFQCSEQMEDIAASIIRNYKEKKPEYLNQLLYSVVPYLIEAFRIIVGDTRLPVDAKHDNPRINQAIDYIKSNISASTTVAEVAQYLHLSTKQFTRIFIDTVGTTPGAFIQNYRVERIRNLLTVQELNIDNVADILGYSDTPAMIKAFKKSEGITPKKYQKSHH